MYPYSPDKTFFKLPIRPTFLVCLICLLYPICSTTVPAQQQDVPLQQIETPLPDTTVIMDLANRGINLMEHYPDSALAICREALTAGGKAGYNKAVARSLYGIGLFYSLQEDYDKCIGYYLQAIQYAAKDSSMYRTINSCIFNIGESYYRKGTYGLSAYYYYKLLSITRFRPNERNVLLMTYNRLAALWIQFGMAEQAFYYVRLQEQIARAIKDKPALSTALSTIGGIYMVLEQNEKALKYYTHALELTREFKDGPHQHHIQTINNNLALLYIRAGDPRKAIPYARNALAIQNSNSSLIGRIDAHYMLGYAYSNLKQYEKAKQYLIPALKESQEKGMTGKTTNAHIFLADIYTATGRYQEALEHLYTYIRINDSLRGEKNAHAAGMLELKYRTSEKDRQLAQKQVELLQQQSKIRTKNTWITGISAGTLLLSVTLIALYRSNRHKQRLHTNQIHLLRQEQELIRLRAMMKGEEQERGRIARELHDGIGGMLAAIRMNMNTVQEQNAGNGEQTNIGRLMRMVDETTTEVRKTAHNLMPDMLTRHSLTEALQIYCEHINTAGGLQLQLKLYGSLSGMDKHIELTLYRIIQELAQNIIKHANATEAVIEVSRAQDMINITVEDNGRGFDPKVNSNGFGLQNLRYRVQALQGDISIESAPGIGTTILIEFDLNKLYHTFAT